MSRAGVLSRMARLNDAAGRRWAQIGPSFLPFADAASAGLPMGRLLRLSLFQVTVGMAAVLLIGTLNRVMIVELGVPAWLVAAMVSLPLVFAPLRAQVREACALGIADGSMRSDVDAATLGRLVEGACIAVLDEATRSGTSDQDGRRMVVVSALGIAGIDWRTALLSQPVDPTTQELA